MKKIAKIAIIIAVCVYGVLCVRQEIKVNEYVSATAAYVQGACKNGAITEKECNSLKNRLSLNWFYHAAARRYSAEDVREIVDAAYQAQRESQTK